MFKRIVFAALCVAGFAGAALADTDMPPVVIGIHDCPAVRSDLKVVKMSFKVTETGKVEDVKIVESSGDEAADKHAAECVAGWSYKPATHNGVAVAKVVTFELHLGGRIGDMSGHSKAFASLERDADRRCHKLYPIDTSWLQEGKTVTLVQIVRLPSGEIQTQVTQSAGEKADKQAVACLVDLVKSHDDLPATFARIIAVDWRRARTTSH